MSYVEFSKFAGKLVLKSPPRCQFRAVKGVYSVFDSDSCSLTSFFFVSGNELLGLIVGWSPYCFEVVRILPLSFFLFYVFVWFGFCCS